MSAPAKPVSDRVVWIALGAVAVVLLVVGGLLGRLIPQPVDEGDCVSSDKAQVQLTDHGLVCQFVLSR
jgi:hypothetical protein